MQLSPDQYEKHPTKNMYRLVQVEKMLESVTGRTGSKTLSSETAVLSAFKEMDKSDISQKEKS